MLKNIGIAARKDLEQQVEKKIHLELFVKVREGWKNDPEVYSRLGLEYKN